MKKKPKAYTQTEHRLMVRLTEENSDFLTQRKAALGVPYNALINLALAEYRKNHNNALGEI